MLNGGIYASHQQTQQERRREQERMQTIDSVLNASNLSNACYEVIRNDGAAMGIIQSQAKGTNP